MANSYQDPGFIVTLTTYVGEILKPLRNALIELPIKTLANIITAAVALALITTIFQILCRGKPPWKIGPLQIKPWVPPAIISFILTLPILLP